MMFRFSFLLLAGVFLPFLSTAQNCPKTSVYFAKAGSVPDAVAAQRIDSLLQTLDTAAHYLVELYAYTDSTSTTDYNNRLAAERNTNVANLVARLRPGHTVFLSKSMGEAYTSADLRENRRVDIYVFPLDSQNRVTVGGQHGESAKIYYREFAGCGYCLSDPQIVSASVIDSNNIESLNLSIVRKCTEAPYLPERADCYAAEFRIPVAVFQSYASIRELSYVYGQSCDVAPNDALNELKNDSLFRIDYDTVTNEYVISYHCYNRERCFRMHRPCEYWIMCKDGELLLPENVAPVRTSVMLTSTSTLFFDTAHVARIGCRGPNTVYSYGRRNGEWVFAAQRNGFQVYDKNHNLPRTWSPVWVLPETAYKPLHYTGTQVRLKLPRGLTCDSIGYYLPEHEFFIPFTATERSRYVHPLLLDREYEIAVYNNGQRTELSFRSLKKRHVKRRSLLKVKLRTADLRTKR